MKKTIILPALFLLLSANQASANLPPFRPDAPPFIPFFEMSNDQSIQLPEEKRKPIEIQTVASSTASITAEQKEQIEQMKKIIEQLNEIIIILKSLYSHE